MTARYALYAAPAPDSALWRFGSSVIGYDAALALEAAFPEKSPFAADDWPPLTADPRRYGFHGTLKAPFVLAEGRSEAELLDAAAAFAQRQRTFVVPRLEVSLLKAFVALVPAEPSAALDALAADCVRHFEPFRAPLSDSDRARRLAAPLTDRQRQHLETWGYPYVFEDFRFHMTLTGALPEDRREPVRAALAALYAPLAVPFAVDALAVFRQERREDRFTVLARLPFAG